MSGGNPRLALRRVGALDVPAASGLACAEGLLWVVSDDRVELVAYTPADLARCRAVTLVGEPLPEATAARKAAKPDLEALTAWPGGALAALGSGSTARRHRGMIVDARAGQVCVVELGEVHAALAHELGALNLEGAVVAGERLVLAQRGNGVGGVNALVELDLGAVVADGAAARPWRADAIVSVRRVDLPELDGVPLGFTDLAVRAGDAAGVVGPLIYYFSAAAEASPDTYQDGAVTGSALGAVRPDGSLHWLQRLDTADKIEGLAFAPGDHDPWLAADADDAARPSPVYRATLPPA